MNIFWEINEKGLCIPCNIRASLFYTTLSLPPSEKKDAWLCTALQLYESQEAVGPGILSQTQAKLLHGSICIQWLVLSALIVIQITGHNSPPKKGFEFRWTDTGKKTSFADLLFKVLNSLGLSFLSLKPKRSCVKVACISA